jgi:hypothetical protein
MSRKVMKKLPQSTAPPMIQTTSLIASRILDDRHSKGHGIVFATG